ncbi:S24/S26 family peptidase [Larkinella soli]|uniref:S24/S26 family peptidase n=1 Tax=Larkinella soli TaxID=1770527 RepID=UPI0019D1650E|nr:S24/S26 family peptidase [Larkinella soli]
MRTPKDARAGTAEKHSGPNLCAHARDIVRASPDNTVIYMEYRPPLTWTEVATHRFYRLREVRMAPTLIWNEMVVCIPLLPDYWKPGPDVVLIEPLNGAPLCGRLDAVDADHLRLRFDNPHFRPLSFPRAEIRVLYEVYQVLPVEEPLPECPGCG